MGHTFSTGENDCNANESKMKKSFAVAGAVYTVQSATKFFGAEIQLHTLISVTEDFEENCVQHVKKKIYHSKTFPILATTMYTFRTTSEYVDCFTVYICLPVIITEVEINFPVISQASSMNLCTAHHHHQLNRECIAHQTPKPLRSAKKLNCSFSKLAASTEDEKTDDCLHVEPKPVYAVENNTKPRSILTYQIITDSLWDVSSCNANYKCDVFEKCTINPSRRLLNICSQQDTSHYLLNIASTQQLVWECLASAVIQEEIEYCCKRKGFLIRQQPLILFAEAIILLNPRNRARLLVQKEASLSKALSILPAYYYERCVVHSCKLLNRACRNLQVYKIAATKILVIKLKNATKTNSDISEGQLKLPSSVFGPELCDCIISSGLMPLQACPQVTRLNHAEVAYIKERAILKGQVYMVSYPLRASIFVDEPEYCVCGESKPLVMSMQKAAKVNIAVTVLVSHSNVQCVSIYFVYYDKCKIVHDNPAQDQAISSTFTPLFVMCAFVKLSSPRFSKNYYKPSRIPIRRERLRSS